MINYSIIIPHYNSSKLLIKLLSTIPNSEDIEIIIVDDNSTESIENILEYAKLYNNISIHVNGTGRKGAGSCRNIGISKAIGKWLIFADADDFFLPEWKCVVDHFLNSDAEVIYFSPHGMDLETGRESKRHLLYKKLVEDYIEKSSKKNTIKLKSGFCTPWSKMFLREFVSKNAIMFDEVLASNDIMFVTKSAFDASKIEASNASIYCVTRSATSLTSKKDKEKFMSRVDVVIRRYKYLDGILTRRDFSYAHIDRYALGKLADALLDGWGIEMFVYILKLYIKNGVKFFDVDLLNPITLISVGKYQVSWWLEIMKHRRRNGRKL